MLCNVNVAGGQCGPGFLATTKLLNQRRIETSNTERTEPNAGFRLKVQTCFAILRSTSFLTFTY